MADTPLPAPTNRLAAFLDAVIKGLIMGLGTNAIVNLGVAQAPWLGLPIIKGVFSWVVDQIGGRVDTGLEQNVNVIVIRFQNDDRKDAYNQAVTTINKPGATNAEIEAGFGDIDAIISRSK